MQDFTKLPWELDMPAEKAAAVLGSYLGVQNLEPAAVLDLDVEQITGTAYSRQSTPQHNIVLVSSSRAPLSLHSLLSLTHRCQQSISINGGMLAVTTHTLMQAVAALSTAMWRMHPSSRRQTCCLMICRYP